MGPFGGTDAGLVLRFAARPLKGFCPLFSPTIDERWGVGSDSSIRAFSCQFFDKMAAIRYLPKETEGAKAGP